MENLIIEVKTAEENKEAQNLFFNLGYCWFHNLKKYRDFFTPEHIMTFESGALSTGIRGSCSHKKITLSELRTLAKKEYLDENFNLVYGSGVYEVPEGAEIAIRYESNIVEFFKDDYKNCFHIDNHHWFDCSEDPKFYKSGSVVWKRNNKCTDTQPQENNHYYINVSDVDEIDFYEIALRYNVTDPCIQHILKKCLAVGNRGHKDFHTDLKDIAKTANRMLVIHGVD